MATLIPALNSVRRKMTGGERRFAERLESHLEDDYLCWYDVPVGRRGVHPDFIILHPRRGILILELKGWKREEIQSIDRQRASLITSSGIRTAPNPLEQARQYAHVIVDMFERDAALVRPADHAYAGKICLPWGYGVVLPNITRRVFEETDLELVLPPDRVICKDEMTDSVDPEAFQAKLWGMFTQQFQTLLTLPQIDRIRWHLFPEIRVLPEQRELDLESPSPAEGGENTVPDLLMVMDMQQEQLARSLGDGHRVIHGVAGSGKTMILGFRAEYLARAMAKPILVLCFNVALAAKLKHAMAVKGLAEKVSVCNFHRWCLDQLTLFHVDKPPHGDGFYERLVEAVIAGVDKGQIPRAQYGAVLIDEGHDFQPEWLRLVVQMIDPDTNLLLLLYDDAQSIYGETSHRNFSFKSVGVQAQGRTTILKLNYRNTSEILQVAAEFAGEVLMPTEADDDGVPLLKPESAGRHGPAPEFYRCADLDAEAAIIAKRVARFRKHGAEWREIAVLCPQRFVGERVGQMLSENDVPFEWLGQNRAHRHYHPDADSVKVMTIHSSKGLEFPVIFICGIGYMPHTKSTPSDDARLLYVGMTRAMVNLVMTSHQDSEFSRRIQAGPGISAMP